MPVTQLIKVSITVIDLTGTACFYRDALGAGVGSEQMLGDPAWNTLLGLDRSTAARAINVTFGHSAIELVAFDPPGRAYPADRAANDQWFEHVALVTADMAAAWQRLRGSSPEEISEGGPQLLPPSTGSVTAFKFRDPEGHPLELIFFPKGVGAPVWQGNTRTGIVGYDHTAISVTDIDRSIAFYASLGLRVGGRSLNRGVEQDRLDGLTGCEVDVVTLEPAVVATPHLELLHYRAPTGRVLTSQVRADAAASARQIYKVDNLDALVKRLEAANVTFVSPGIVTLTGGDRAAAIRDPDGHMIVLIGD